MLHHITGSQVTELLVAVTSALDLSASCSSEFQLLPSECQYFLLTPSRLLITAPPLLPALEHNMAAFLLFIHFRLALMLKENNW